MLLFLESNLGTILVGAILLTCVIGVIAKMVKDKREGDSSCGCSDCGKCGGCHSAASVNRKVKQSS